MPIRLLVANGCSYTRGAELPDPEGQAWPARLAARLGVDVVNLACDGGSNRRVVRTTVAHLERVCEERDVPVADTLVLCMWSGLARGECHSRRRDPGNRPRLPYETNWHRLGRWRIDERHAASIAYFRDVWSEEGAVVDLLTDWLLLDAFLTGLNAAARYAFAWDVLPARLPEQARSLAARLDPRRVYGQRTDRSDVSFYGTVHRRFPTGKLYHPLTEAHDYLAGELEEWLRGQGLAFPPGPAGAMSRGEPGSGHR